MSAQYFLGMDDFHVVESHFKDGHILANHIKGLSVCFFYSPRCPYCYDLLPKIKKIRVNGVQIGLANTDNMRDLIARTQYTKYPIRVTPTLTMYNNGIPFSDFPFSKFQGPITEHTISDFIIQMALRIQDQMKKDAQHNGGSNGKGKRERPAYSLGEPLYGDDLQNVTYIQYEDAYTTSGGATANGGQGQGGNQMGRRPINEQRQRQEPKWNPRPPEEFSREQRNLHYR